MHDPKGFYSILELDTSASDDDIKRAYRVAARKYHPDISKEPDANEKMAAINEAYDTLSDSQKKAEYDNPPPPINNFNTGFMGGFNPFMDFFQSERPTQIVNSDQTWTVRVNIENTFDTNKKLFVKYKSRNLCETCKGAGAKNWEPCPGCNGHGIQIKVEQHGNFISQTQMQCGFCQGKGKKIIDICEVCSGFGTTEELKEIVIENTYESFYHRLFFAQKGHRDKNLSAPAGNLYVIVELEVDGGEVDPSTYDVFKHHDINALHYVTKNIIKLNGIHSEVHEIRLNCDQTQYVIANAGMPLGSEKRSDLIFDLKPILIPIDDEELSSRIKNIIEEKIK